MAEYVSGWVLGYESASEYATGWPLPILPARERASGWGLGYQISTKQASGWDLGYLIAAPEERASGWELGYQITDRDEHVSGWNLGYLFESGARDIALSYDVTVGGARLESVYHISFKNTFLSYKHSATLSMSGPADVLLCPRGEVVVLSLMGTDIEMIAVSAGRTRSGEGWVYTVELESPACLLDAPFASQLAGEYAGPAAVIGASVAGSFPLSWDTVSWPISAGLLDGSDRTPRAMLTMLAETAGGRLRSEFDGSATVAPDYPVQLSLWSAAAATYTINNVQDLDSDSVTQSTGVLYNAVEVGTSAADDSSTTIKQDTVAGNDGSVTVRVHMVPWDSGVVFEQTGGAAVSVELLGDVTRTETETVQLVDGVGSVGFPVVSVISYDYSEDDLGTLTVEADGSVSSAILDESLVEVTYTTRSRNFRLTSTTGDDVLVVSETVDFATVGSSILVRTGAGDMEADGIFEELLTTDAVRRERGRNYLDAVSSRRETVTMQCPLTAIYRPGELVQVVDPVDGSWIGLLHEQLVELGIAGDTLTATSQLTIEREAMA